MNTFVIDDLRNFRDGRAAVIARTSQEALTFLNNNKDTHFTDIWFDHDLGEVEGTLDTTMPIVDYFSERAFYDNPVNVDIINVHTSNPVGAQQIILSLEHYGYNVRKVQAALYFIV